MMRWGTWENPRYCSQNGRMNGVALPSQNIEALSARRALGCGC
jgi:hypothetical protein